MAYPRVSSIGSGAYVIIILVIVFITCSTEKQILKQRIIQHKSSIRHNDVNYLVAQYFNSFSHLISSSLRFQGIGHIELPREGNMERKICQRQLFWIETLHILQPMGLDDYLDMIVQLLF